MNADTDTIIVPSISPNGTVCCQWNATSSIISTNISGALPGFCRVYI